MSMHMATRDTTAMVGSYADLVWDGIRGSANGAALVRIFIPVSELHHYLFYVIYTLGNIPGEPST